MLVYQQTDILKLNVKNKPIIILHLTQQHVQPDKNPNITLNHWQKVKTEWINLDINHYKILKDTWIVTDYTMIILFHSIFYNFLCLFLIFDYNFNNRLDLVIWDTNNLNL